MRDNFEEQVITTHVTADRNLGEDHLTFRTLKTQSSVSSSSAVRINGPILALFSLITVFKRYKEQATTSCAVAHHNLGGHPGGDPGCAATRVALSKLYYASAMHFWDLGTHNIVLRVITLKILMEIVSFLTYQFLRTPIVVGNFWA